MIHIQKGREPDSLTAYRKQAFATYEDFAHKDKIREALLRDQGHICAYCMRRIINDGAKMKIEHWTPQSKLESEAEKLDYRIMLGVCDGCAGDDYAYTTCDTHRGNADLTVNPLNAHMMHTISHTRDGRITSSNEAIQEDLDNKLNLNCVRAKSQLVSSRKKVYGEVSQRLNGLWRNGKWTHQMLQKVADDYERKEGKYLPYVGVAQFLLQKYLRKMK